MTSFCEFLCIFYRTQLFPATLHYVLDYMFNNGSLDKYY